MLDTDNRTEFGPFSGFPRGVNHTPVPDPLLAELLERIDDVEELKLALRCVWLLNKKNPAQRFLTCDELYADSTVANMLKLYGEDLNQRVSQITECLTKHGVLLQALTNGQHIYLLNTEAGRQLVLKGGLEYRGPELESVTNKPSENSIANIVKVYESNIGVVTPIIAERLRILTHDYQEQEIQDAINVAVGKNARNLRFIEAVLANSNKKGYGESKPRTKEDRERLVRNYLKQVRDRRR